MKKIDFIQEFENFKNKEDNNSKIQSLWNLLYEEEIIKSNYQHIIRFLIENAKKINKIFLEEEKNTNLTISKTLIEKIKEKLEIFTSFNSEYLALNEFFDGIFEQIYNKNKNKKYIPYKKNNYSFEELLEKDISKMKKIFNKFFIEGTKDSVINDLNTVFNIFSNFKFESFKDKNILNDIISKLCHFYPLFNKHQREKIKEKYLNYFINNNNSKIGNIIFPSEDNKISFPKFPIDESELVNILQVYKQSNESIFILFYFLIFTENFLNKENKAKIIYFLITILKSFRLEEDNLLKDFYYLKKFKDTSKLEIINDNNVINLKDIFSGEYITMYNKVLNNILSEFYIIPKKLKIVEPENLTFIFGLIKLYYINEKIDKKQLKENLKKLEGQIYETFKKANAIKNKTFDIIKINREIKHIFYEIQKKLNNIPSLSSFNYKLILYPFGSLTQGLGNKNSDLDTYLEIKKDNKKKPCDESNIPKLLEDIYNYLKLLDPKITYYITKRLCLFSFTYKELKIDINYYGICSVLGSHLLLKYSLIDARFPILAIFLKEILNKYNIKNDETNKTYLNSFSWMCILLCFLQDIIDPPILPKLLDYNKNIKEITIKIGGKIKGVNKENFNDVINSEKIESFYSIDFKKIDEFINNKQFISENKMTVSEIFLMFCKFIGFYFHYQTICANCSFEFQGFVPKKFLQENMLKGDIKGKNFFKKVMLKDNFENIYIREPFDHTYNPAKEVSNENMNFIIKQFKEIYFKIINNGDII